MHLRLSFVPCRRCQGIRDAGHDEQVPTCHDVELVVSTNDGAYHIDGEGRMSRALATVIVDAVNALQSTP